MTDEESIRQVLARFIQLRDDKRFAEWVELFTEDGTFEYGSNVMRGRTAIRNHVENLLRNDRGKHLCLNSIIDVIGDRATVSSDFVKLDLVVHPGTTWYQARTMGRYKDRFVLQDDGWKIAARRVDIASA